MIKEKVPMEVKNLLNPAFNSVILYYFIKSYNTSAKKSISYSILFVFLPLILHKSTREALPLRAKTKLHIWLKNNPQMLIDFAKRAKNMVRFTKEAILFGIDNKLIRIEHGRLIASETHINLPWEDNSECFQIKTKAEFLGKWLSNFEDSLIFSALGVRP